MIKGVASFTKVLFPVNVKQKNANKICPIILIIKVGKSVQKVDSKLPPLNKRSSAKRRTMTSLNLDQFNARTIHRAVNATATECLNERGRFISSD